jgi:hypothetical protein
MSEGIDGNNWWEVRWALRVIWLVWYMAVLSIFLGGTSTASAAALVIVIGIEIIRRRRKKAGKFGDVARGSVVQDHTDK